MTTRHPLFARVYTRISVAGERYGIAEHRDEMLRALSGRVVEVGAGNGLNFAHYPPAVTDVVAVEPEPYLRERARAAAASAPVPVHVVEGTAEHVPGADGEYDGAVASLVLCSVPDPAAALRELHRVVRPDGMLAFYEHVLATNENWARRQRRVAPLWSRVAGGCRPDRDTEATITGAGFELVGIRRFLFAPGRMARLVAPTIVGTARRA